MRFITSTEVRKLISGGAKGAFVRVSSLFLYLIVSIVVARQLGPEELGHFSIALTFLVFFATPIYAGLNGFMSREMARGIEVNDKGRIKAAYIWAHQYVWLMACGFVVVIAIGSVTLPQFFDETYTSAFLIGLPFLALRGFLSIQEGFAQGQHSVASSHMPFWVIRPALYILLIFAIAYVLQIEATINNIMMAYIISLAGAWVYAYIVYRRIRPTWFSGQKPSKPQHRNWILALIGLAGGTGISVIMFEASLIVLARHMNAEFVGYYKLAVTISGLALTTNLVTNLVFSPHFAAAHASNRTSDLQRLTTMAAACNTLGAILIVAVFFFISEPLIAMLYGENFTPSVAPLIVLMMFQVLSATFGSVEALQNMSLNEKSNFIVALTTLIINVVFCYIMIPQFGMLGAAYTAGAARVCYSFMNASIIYYKLGVNPTIYPVHTLVRVFKPQKS